MRGMQLALLVLASAERNDVGRAESAAVPVVQSLLTWVQKSKAASSKLHDDFGAWCSETSQAQAKLRDETARRVADAERKLEQMRLDAKRVQSTQKLIATATNATVPRGIAVTALSDIQDQVKTETDFLVRAQGLVGQALHQATLSSDPDAGESAGLESSNDGVVALLSKIMHEATVQREEVSRERDSLADLFTKFNSTEQSAASLLSEETEEMGSEARARVRSTARVSSELADLRRVVTAATVAQNATADVCQGQASPEQSGRQDSADEWAVRSALDALVPAQPVSFLQVRAAAGVRMTRAARLAAGLVQMAARHQNPALEQAAQVLEKKDLALSVSSTSGKASPSSSSESPLDEIAAFGDGDTTDASTGAATDAYNGMRGTLDAQLKQLGLEEAHCHDAEATAADGNTLVEKTASKNAALLKVATTLTDERKEDVSFLHVQVSELQTSRAKLHSLEDAEKSAFEQLEAYAKDGPVQLYSVATDLSAAGNPKVGTQLESLVNMLQKRTQAAEKQHLNFAEWTESLEKSLADLERALNIDEAHTTRRARDSEAEQTYRASMAASAEQGQTAVLAVRSDASSCEDQAKPRAAKRASLQEQLQQLDALWSHVQGEPDA